MKRRVRPSTSVACPRYSSKVSPPKVKPERHLRDRRCAGLHQRYIFGSRSDQTSKRYAGLFILTEGIVQIEPAVSQMLAHSLDRSLGRQTHRSDARVIEQHHVAVDCKVRAELFTDGLRCAHVGYPAA